MKHPDIYSATTLTAFIHEIGFLPLLDSGIHGYSAEDAVDEDCQYVVFPDGGWDWPLWKWKGEIVREGDTMYGKFFNKKAGFIAREWWADFCNYRRSKYPLPEEGTIEDAILTTLKVNGSLITRELRAACGFDGKGMRSKFDGYITRLQMATYIVTEDFVYPQDKHGKQYGWGWSLLTTPEALCGKEFCQSKHTPEESFQRLYEHFTRTGIIPSDGKIEEVVIKAYWNAPDYLRTLPLHESQREMGSGDGYAVFSYNVKLTYDFMQLIMRQGDQVEALSPESLRNDMRNLAKTLTSYYKD